MSTLGDQLNILRNTQMVQRRHLEKLYPYLDWSKMPFSSYNDFFRLKNIIDDCGAVWTNAYMRSNNEAADTRKYLKDWSGNGRDIELFNFAFAGMSGYGGYPFNFLEWGSDINSFGGVAIKTHSSIRVENWGEYPNYTFARISNPTFIGNFRIKIVGLKDGASVYFIGTKILITVSENGEYLVPADDSLPNNYYFNSTGYTANEEADLYIELLPVYPGALVSDGVDDYGQCIKDFALPDDFTVVAVRKILKTNGDDCLVAKSMEPDHGAFIIDYSNKGNISGGFNGHSYGYIIKNPYVNEPLFSYLTKTSYNGQSITVGTRPDTDADKVAIFTKRKNTDGTYMSAALSSFGIFTRTLTEDELRIVKNCMMAEYIAMTGILDDVEYYDILDARFRSNEEDAEKRNKWTGRFGKLHMTLHNYAFADNSGWNGQIGEDGRPQYPGALVSDGVDDNAVSDEVMDEEIGSVVVHNEIIDYDKTQGRNSYLFATNTTGETDIYAYITHNGAVIMGAPYTSTGGEEEFKVLSRVPEVPGKTLKIASYNGSQGFLKYALYQLRLIKSQPTDIQLEAIKWQMQKEHEDYLIQNGWMEIEPDEQ